MGGSGLGRALHGPAGLDRIARRHRERGMADSGSDADVVRAVLDHLMQQQEQGRDLREVLRGVWAASMTALRRAISRLP